MTPCTPTTSALSQMEARLLAAAQERELATRHVTTDEGSTPR
jgi:hypothetical protein